MNLTTYPNDLPPLRYADSKGEQTMQTTPEPTYEQLLPADGEAILARLPERIRVAFNERASELDYPVEAVLEIALAGYLDQSAIAFVDCKPKRSKRVA